MGKHIVQGVYTLWGRSRTLCKRLETLFKELEQCSGGFFRVLAFLAAEAGTSRTPDSHRAELMEDFVREDVE
jgi:hypothetical protein